MNPINGTAEEVVALEYLESLNSKEAVGHIEALGPQLAVDLS